ncbi:MAG: hypothetical protein H6509_00225 [Bryobacterales bacterium]|nr:hypothetical protein [Bryobacterales bacterium]
MLVEPGEPAAPLRPGGFALHPRSPGCVLEIWGEGPGLVRRIIETGRAESGRLPLKARTFGAGEIALEIVDKAAGGARRLNRVDGMGRFTKFLSRLLAREFPLHRVSRLSAAQDLRRSLSSSYVRGVLKKGADSWALIAAPLEASPEICDQMLAYGLLWLHEVRSGVRDRQLAGLLLLLPEGRAGVTLQRIPWLDAALAPCRVLEFDRNGAVRARDVHDAPPLELALPPCASAPAPEGWVRALTEELARLPGVRWRARPDGLLSFEVGGLSFARAGARTLSYGLESDQSATPEARDRVFGLAEHLRRFRCPETPDRAHPLYLLRPEAWLAEKIRETPAVLSPSIDPDAIYSGVPAVEGRDRGILDLLAIEADGRLLVVELKASEDIHLPIQALDYWIRVRKLAEEGAFAAKGYFPGRAVSTEPPRLIFAAPSLHYHPQTDQLLRCLSHEILIERVGLGSDWRRRASVEFRIAERFAGSAAAGLAGR